MGVQRAQVCLDASLNEEDLVQCDCTLTIGIKSQRDHYSLIKVLFVGPASSSATGQRLKLSSAQGASILFDVLCAYENLRAASLSSRTLRCLLKCPQLGETLTRLFILAPLWGDFPREGQFPCFQEDLVSVRCCD